MTAVASIPPEIWIQIFRLATEDGGSTLENLQVGPNDTLHAGWKESVGYRESLKTKVALVETCRQWNSIATPLLYQHITITSSSQYRRALEAFKGDHSERYKHLVTRLNFVCPEGGKAFKILVELCSMFRELTTLVASLVLQMDDEPSRLLNAFSPNLRNLYLLPHSEQELRAWTLDLNKIPFSLIIDFLDEHPQLAGVSIPYLFHKTAEENNFDQTWSSKRWPSLKTLVLQEKNQAEAILTYLPGKAFPNIQTINGSWNGSGGCDDLYSVVSTHTSRGLLYLSTSISSWDVAALSKLLRGLGTLCPVLREIHVWLDEHAQLSLLNQVGKAPQITTVGVHLSASTGGVHRREVIVEMHYLVCIPWTKVFPNLTTIRLMEKVDFASYRELDEFTRANLRSPGRYVNQPIRVEDQDGQFLAQFTAGFSTLVEL